MGNSRDGLSIESRLNLCCKDYTTMTFNKLECLQLTVLPFTASFISGITPPANQS